MKTFLTHRLTHFILLFLLLIGLVSIRIADPYFIRDLRLEAFDTYNKIKPRPAEGSVKIIDIDEKSLAQVGQWPWPRTVLAELVDKLTAAGAKVIAFDMVFAEQDRMSPEFLKEHLRVSKQAELQSDPLDKLQDPDAIFAEAIRNSGKVVTGFVWSNQTGALRTPFIHRPLMPFGPAGRAFAENALLIRDVTTNIPEIARAAEGNGSFSVSPEHDGIIREVPLVMRYLVPGPQGGLAFYPGLSLEALRIAKAGGASTRLLPVKEENQEVLSPDYLINVGPYYIPSSANGQFWVYYRHLDRDKDYVSAQDILRENARATEAVRDKIVFIGTSAAGLKDIRSTPLDLFVPGVEVHFNATEQILQENYLQRPEIAEGAELVFIALMGLILIALAPFLGAVLLTLIVGASVAGAVGLSWHFFTDKGLLIDPVTPSLSVLAIHFSALFLAYIRTAAEKGAVRKAFSLYISPEYMQELTKNPERLTLGGEERELSVMFSDIRNFTSISERLSPGELTSLMNSFLTPMTDVIMQKRGTIDKYMGDAIMAFWNAPLDDPDHAAHACEAALLMRDAVAPVNAQLAEDAAQKGTEPLELKAGIGVSTGLSLVGNMGSAQRFAYSALGDTINLGARLEGQTKTYGVDILISEETYQKAPNFAALEVDLLRVKGKTKPVHIYALFGGRAMAGDKDFLDWKDMHTKFLDRFRNQDWDQAEALLRKMPEDNPLSLTYAMYAERLTLLKAEPPGADWDGAFTAESK